MNVDGTSNTALQLRKEKTTAQKNKSTEVQLNKLRNMFEKKIEKLQRSLQSQKDKAAEVR